MTCDTIKFKLVQDPITKTVNLQIFRPYSDGPKDWMLVDHFNEMTIAELRCLNEYITTIFNNSKKSG
jgi:hypothetical protein